MQFFILVLFGLATKAEGLSISCCTGPGKKDKHGNQSQRTALFDQ